MRNLGRRFAAVAMSMLALGSMAWAQGQEITFSAMGDGPYGADEVPEFQEQLSNHNRYSPSAFFVHVGDIFKGGEPCDSSHYAAIANIMLSLAVPVYILPGDNETIDCVSTTQALALWKQQFINYEQLFCGATPTTHDSVRPENWAFLQSGVLFIGINMVGGNSPYADDANWVTEQLQTHGASVRAAVVFSHIAPTKSTLFSTPFRQAASAFGKPVLFLHGHGHSWSMTYPFPEANILAVQVDNMSAEDPVEVTVTMDTSTPATAFTLKRDPWESETIINMPPCVDAGPGQLVTLFQPDTLTGSASDDGDPNPPAAMTFAWSKVSGPGTVTFGSPNALVTTVSFVNPGNYILRLTANDSQLQKSDDVAITVLDGKPIINSFNPTSGAPGTEVTITGSYFSGATGATFNGVTASSLVVDSDTQARATVPPGATTGKIGVTNAAGTGLSATDFFTQYSLIVNTFGYGSVALNPSGGIYAPGTEVTLTATPALGYQFSGWSGDLSGASNPATITMNANKNVTAIFTATNPSSQITHQETQTGGSSNSTKVKTTAPLTAVSGQLYLAAIATRSKVGVLSVSGLGLNWTLVQAQCAGRNSTGVEVWKAFGTPTQNDTVMATLASAPNNAVIAVSRYSGVDATAPLGNVISGNTLGLNGLCAGGVDTSFYSFNLNATTAGAVIYATAAMRAKTHSPGPNYIERAEVQQGSSNNIIAAVAVEDKSVTAAGATLVKGNFNGNVDWAVVAVEIKPQLKLTINTMGSGSVTCNPPGNAYDSGTVVTLTATSDSGYQFSGWSGDLSGTSNPATLTMTGHKTITAIFTPPQYTLTVNTVGSGSVLLNPPGGTYGAGTVVTLTPQSGSGFQFSGWSGDLSSTDNPATITMNGAKTVTANFSAAPIVYYGTKTGGAINSSTVTTAANLTAGNGHLYLAAISMRPKVSVSSMSGLGLNWSLVKTQCSSQNSTGIEVWKAQGTPNGNGAVTATFASAPKTAVIAVSRYSGMADDPIGNLLAGNANGVDAGALCTGGVDSNSYAFDLATTTDGAMVYGAVALKARKHTPGAGYLERAEKQQLNGNFTCTVAVEDKVAIPGDMTVNGAFSGVVDWAVVAIEIKPKQYTLTVNTTGFGNVTANPASPSGVYNAGTVVTLTAIPAEGFQFTGWSGDLSGAVNPATVTMNANKTVTATFIPSNAVVHEETRTGSSSGSPLVQTSESLLGVTGHLYLAAISSQPKRSVSSVTGLGLNWSLLQAQCSGRSTTGVEVWMAQGEPSSDDTVKAMFSSAPINAVIAVSRYSGAHETAPIGNVLSGNSNGVNAAALCSGGVDSDSYSFNLNMTAGGAVAYGAAAMKIKTHTPGAGYSERAEVQKLGNSLPAGVAVEDQLMNVIGPVSVNGSFNGAVDWAAVAVEIKPLTLSKKEVRADNEKPVAPPSAYLLRQNYPNPFNPSTTIQFELPQASPVKLTVYNLRGEAVRTLLERELPAGYHHLTFDARGLASGLYFYRLEAGVYKMTRKMILQK